MESALGLKFIRCLLRHGKKSEARRILSEALRIVSRRLPHRTPEQILEQAVNNRVQSLRIAGIPIIPQPLLELTAVLAALQNGEQLKGRAIQSITKAAARRKERTPAARLAAEIYEAYLGPQGPEDPLRAVEAISRHVTYDRRSG